MNLREAPTSGRCVGDVMTKCPITVNPSTSFQEIVRLLVTHRISTVPVLDGDRRPIGIVSEADLLHKEANPDPDAPHPRFEGSRRRHERAKAAALVAADLMSRPVHTVRADAGLGETARLLHDKGVKRLPVVDDAGRLVGIVSRGDMLTAFLRPDADLVREVQQEVMVRTLWMDPTLIGVTALQGVVSLEGVVDRRSDIPILTRLIHGVDGVVGVRSLLSFRYDDSRSQGFPDQGSLGPG